MSDAMVTANGIQIDPKYKKYVKFGLNNVKGFWIKVLEPDTAYEHKWSIDLHLTDAQATELKAVGFSVKDEVKNKKGEIVGKNVLKVSKKVKNKDGSDNKPPFVVSQDGRTPWTEPLGNGSLLNLKLSAKAWYVQGKWTLSCYLDGVQVVVAEEYGSGFGDVTEEDMPF